MKPNDLAAPDIDRLVVDLADQGEFRVHRDVFRDPAVFELEMKYIFERNWVFVGLDSQAPNPNDYFTTWIGRQPIIVARDKQGKLGAFINSCSHKGARIAHHRDGNAKQWVCSYHGWAFDTAGACIYIKDQDAGCYAEPFNRLDHGLKKLKFDAYRGFLFASLSDDVPSLDEHLGEARKLLDLVWDQGPDGIEAIPGVSSYTYNANWKMQVENCIDAYHLTSCHPSFMNIVSRRKAGESRNKQVKSIDFNVMDVVKGGTACFPRGHAVIYATNPLENERGLFVHRDEAVARCGETKTKWMLATRNLTIYPNVQFAENASLQMRVIRPLSVDKTEMTIYCIGAKGESDAAREIRIRQYEDFFNTSGMATPDDTIAYEDCQVGFKAGVLTQMQGYCRGMTNVVSGADDRAAEIGFTPATSSTGPFAMQDETVMFGGYRAWKKFIKDGLAADGAA
ncbi:aromatic ring-hydroxylating dioxygenase subunit alpha [Immundisolibacter sp.]|uniref:aromatic ring-hydroxylating oxygenase subunit alpha n=1 Tax=Immundisolibacter sp. TaxID=1934948 RepID=UPI002B14BABF|nr:aromatic ring-hydroxylating dioxygenase subunit alpha [Immundisolibacter sp.]MEA3220523.1 2-halobenzoate 1,2-dioxygenase large subunit [Immundisolibacter sp.]